MGASDLGLERALRRFEEVMSEAQPDRFQQLRPGANDDDLRSLGEVIAPYQLPAQVETLYRWRNGGDPDLFGGWGMYPIDELIDWYQFTVSDLESPRTWLPVFAGQMVNIVTLDVPGRPPSDRSVWYGHTHDAYLWRLFPSIEALLDVVCDAQEAGVVIERHGRLGLACGDYLESVDGETWAPFRAARCADCYRRPDPPAGSDLSRGPDSQWPREWLLGLGVTDDSLTLRGVTHTIAQLVDAAAEGPVRGTIRVRVLGGSGGTGFASPVVADHTGKIVVYCDVSEVPMARGLTSEMEFDVVLESADIPERIENDNPQVAAVANRLRPPLPTARALAARPVD